MARGLAYAVVVLVLIAVVAIIALIILAPKVGDILRLAGPPT